jgi:quercetin dioxygenase-like cupin family protein
MGRIVKEFATTWEGDQKLWFERDEDELVGTQQSGGVPIPRIRICDVMSGPTNRERNKAPVLWSGEDGVVESHFIHGAETHFHRPSNYDVLILQFAGKAAVETEFGEFRLEPGHAMHIPTGAAYRIIGNSQSHQLIAKVREKFDVTADPAKPLTETVFDVRRKGDNAESEPVAFPARKGKILEVTEFWNDEADPIVIERDHAKLVGCAAANSQRKVTVLRAFDYFCGITGKGGVRAPELFKGKKFKVDVYNTEGEQHGFHRGCDSEEIWFQFRGEAKNDTEWGVHHLSPGEIGYVPRGIAHRITGDKNFLRFNFYFQCQMRPKVDASNHHGESTYEVETPSRTELPAFAEAKKRIEEALAKNQPVRM